MPENPTIEEVTKRLGNLIKVAEMSGFNVIASLWLNEAKVIYEALNMYMDLE